MRNDEKAKMSVITLSIVLYVVGVALAYKATRNLLSIPMFVLYIWGFGLIGAMQYYFKEDHSLTPIVVGLSSMSVGFGSRFSSLIVRFNPKKESHDITSQRLPIGIANKTALGLAIISSVVLILFATFLILKNAPFLTPGTIRRIVFVQPGMGIAMRLMHTGLPILSVILLLLAIRLGRIRDWVALGFMFVITILAFVLTGYRGFVPWFMVLVLIVLGYIAPSNRRMKLTAIIILSLIGLVSALIVIYISPGQAQGSVDLLLSHFWNRVTSITILGVDYVLYELVPYHGFYYGQTMIWDFVCKINDLTQGVLFPNPHQNLPSYVSFLLVGHENPYAVTTMIMGDLYANWGIVGVILGCFFYGILIETLYIGVFRMRKTIISLLFFAYLSWIFVQMASTGGPISFFISSFFSLCLVYALLMSAYIYFQLPFINREKVTYEKKRIFL